MLNFIKKLVDKAGAPPGTVMYIGKDKSEDEPVDAHIFNFTRDSVEEKTFVSMEECIPFLKDDRVTWITLSGLHKIRNVEKLGAIFNIHKLALEDIVNTCHFPKAEKYNGALFIVLKHLNFDSQNLNIHADQISIYTRKNEVVTFMENPSDVFLPIIRRLRANEVKIQKMEADYLTYSLIDAVVDDYYRVLDEIGDKIETIEDEALINPSPQVANDIYKLRNALFYTRRQIAPLREAVNSFLSIDFAVFDQNTFLYLRDVYDHIIQILDSIDIYREILGSLTDIYLSANSNRMNEIMKVLTIIATIFIPLTFLAGVYGMNFRYMPELEWKYGYYLIWAIMILIAVIMLLFFRKRRWI